MKIIGKVHNSMYQQLQKTGVVIPEQVLLDLGFLSKEDYEIRSYAAKNNLKASWTFYKQWGDTVKVSELKNIPS